ncbi:MAG: cell division protein FtsZ [Parcubacteria group bacterium Gr01-1014_13]|nr:MAG: cell division protein FtsZ [Parcubacteria group bacterium Gr01-1014_13]
MPQVKPDIETFAKIKVIGVGGSGGSAVNRMVGGRIRGVDFVAMNTDVQALHHSSAPQKLHIGKSVTRGLGAGMDPDVGRKAAEETQNEIRDLVKDADMVFVTCGLGGGTGSGAAPVVASVAKEAGALTIAVVTKPFGFEGPQRRDIADKAWEQLARNVDAIITIPNDRILQIIDKKTTLLESFKIVDDVLRQGVQGIAELITIPGLINVDFADVKTIMRDAGSALMGIGVGEGENKAADAAKSAISSPLLELSIDGARGILFTITGGPDMTMTEVSEAAKIVTSSAAENAKVIFGATIDESMKDCIRIAVIATGFDDRRPSLPAIEEEQPTPSFFSGGNKFMSSNFMRKVQKDEEEEEKKFKQIIHNNNISSQPPMPKSPPPQQPKDKNNGEDELEIPAFIRKKMGI